MAPLKRRRGIEIKFTALGCYCAQSEHSREMDWIWESEAGRNGVFGDEMTVKCAEGGNNICSKALWAAMCAVVSRCGAVGGVEKAAAQGNP